MDHDNYLKNLEMFLTRSVLAPNRRSVNPRSNLKVISKNMNSQVSNIVEKVDMQEIIHELQHEEVGVGPMME